jgi:UDPglucose 6-dehydrogenase
MKVTVVGLWHLGLVTAACLAKLGHEVTAFDSDESRIQDLKKGKAPIFEPGLDELLAEGVEHSHLHFTSQAKDISESDVVWVTYDTPVDENDRADTEFVVKEVTQLFPHLKANSIVLISSQLPAGSTMQLQKTIQEQYSQKHISFAYSPENLRLGKAIEVFMNPERVIVGVQSDKDKERIVELFEGVSNNVIFMSVPSAEMTKHALNAFLATSVVFINELSSLCEQVGADASEVERGLKSEGRIGEKAYLRPGNAFAGGTLARDVTYLIEFGKKFDRPAGLFSAILESNHQHKQWAARRLLEIIGDVRGKTIAVLGLTYKPGTNTLRRSGAVEMCHWLSQQGVNVVAYDPSMPELPEDLAACVDLKSDIKTTLKDADAAVLCTEWSDFADIKAEDFVQYLKQPMVFDANGFLTKSLRNDHRVRHFTVGKIA